MQAGRGRILLVIEFPKIAAPGPSSYCVIPGNGTRQNVPGRWEVAARGSS